MNNKYISLYFFDFEPVFKEKRTVEQEKEVVNNLLLSVGFEEDAGRTKIWINKR